MDQPRINPFEALRLSGWQSPRISFSRDFVTLSPDNRKLQHQQQAIIDDNFSPEFEFSTSKRVDLSTELELGIMRSADELFMDGKLRPLPRIACRNRTSIEQLLAMEAAGEDHGLIKQSRSESMPIDSRRKCISLTNSRCSSPPRSSSLPPTTPPSPKHPPKKFRDLFKLKNLHSSTSEIARDSSLSSSCRLPISPRSFWPFSRRSMAESITSNSNSAAIKPPARPASLPTPQFSPAASSLSPRPKKCNGNRPFPMCGTEASSFSAQSASSSPLIYPPPFCYMPASGLSVLPMHKEGAHQSWMAAASIAIGSETNNRQLLSNVTVNFSGKKNKIIPDFRTSSTARIRDYGTPAKPVRRGSSNPATIYATGSSGGRGVRNSPGKDNREGGPKGNVKLQDLWNREGWKASERTTSYASVRVTPVLNVPICMGTPSFRGANMTSKSKLFSWRSFFSKGEKPSRPQTRHQ